MNHYFDQREIERFPEARDSFSGRPLTDPQFDEVVAIVGIVKREIMKTGAFKEKLGDYAYALARTERFDVGRAETIIRDLFKVIIGKTMNQMREELAEREAKLTVDQKITAHEFASGVGNMIQHGDKISFNRAFAHQGEMLARELGITDAAAKRLMKEEFTVATDLDLYEWGKNLEDVYYHPQIDAERQQAEERREQNGSSRSESRSRTNGRSRGENGASSGDEDRTGGSFRRAARNEGGSEEMASAQGAERSAPARTQQRRMRYGR